MLTRSAVFSLAWPVVLAQMATAATGVIDTAIMGRYGDKADLAAVAIAAVAYSFIYWGFGFLRMATTGLSAQAGGRGDRAETHAILLRALLLGAALGLVLLLLSPLLRWISFAVFEGEAPVETLAMRRQAPPPPQQSGVMGMLGGLLDADGDGSAMDDIFEMVMKRR